jgi:hypothetical protein
MIALDPNLTLKPDDAFFILLKAREFDAKEEMVDPDEGSNPSDDNQVDVLQFQADDPCERELMAAVAGLDRDAQLDLIALLWIGRGDFELKDWREAREGAGMIDRSHVPTYVREMPMASDYLEEALSGLGLPLADYLDASADHRLSE